MSVSASNRAISAKGTPSLDELTACYSSERGMHAQLVATKWGIPAVPLVFGFVAWHRGSWELRPFEWLMAFVSVLLGAATILTPLFLAKRRSRVALPWEYTLSARAISFGVGGRVQTLSWERVNAFVESDDWFWIYAPDGMGIPILKRLFDADELDIVRDRLSHAKRDGARSSFRKQHMPLLFWMICIFAALAYFQLSGSAPD